jgi:hypothetical protein
MAESWNSRDKCGRSWTLSKEQYSILSWSHFPEKEQSIKAKKKCHSS